MDGKTFAGFRDFESSGMLQAEEMIPFEAEQAHSNYMLPAFPASRLGVSPPGPDGYSW